MLKFLEAFTRPKGQLLRAWKEFITKVTDYLNRFVKEVEETIKKDKFITVKDFAEESELK